jgi:hypothetical protein
VQVEVVEVLVAVPVVIIIRVHLLLKSIQLIRLLFKVVVPVYRVLGLRLLHQEDRVDIRQLLQLVFLYTVMVAAEEWEEHLILVEPVVAHQVAVAVVQL